MLSLFLTRKTRSAELCSAETPLVQDFLIWPSVVARHCNWIAFLISALHDNFSIFIFLVPSSCIVFSEPSNLSQLLRCVRPEQALTLLSLSGVAATCNSNSSSVSMLTNSSPMSAARENTTFLLGCQCYRTLHNQIHLVTQLPNHSST